MKGVCLWQFSRKFEASKCFLYNLQSSNSFSFGEKSSVFFGKDAAGKCFISFLVNDWDNNLLDADQRVKAHNQTLQEQYEKAEIDRAAFLASRQDPPKELNVAGSFVNMDGPCSVGSRTPNSG